ncbi:hydroxyacid dehydrogenase [Lentilactobacillus hilgardii]|uniref:hydroxyacid dehydrogenase n=1 Tax=Lentilactobacillus hilgardii TaxID=1588 RepID=UPI0039E8535B
MSKIIYIPQDVADSGKEFLKDKGYEVKVGTGTDAKTVLNEGKDAEGILLRGSRFDKEIIDGLTNVKIIARHGVGYDNVDVDEATLTKKWVTITPLANDSSVAETTLSLLFAAAKNLKNNIEHMARGDYFYKNAHKGVDLEGKTLGIVGYGKIGKKVAEKVKGLNMDVLIYDPYVKKTENGKIVSREELLSKSDFVSLHLPATPETKGTFGSKEFSTMKDSAVLINLARGSIVNEKELIEALKNGVISGAALDVYSTEPLPLENSLYEMENVILTPHIGSNSVETMDRMSLHAAMEIDRVLSGEKPKWAINTID